jgi:NADH:ubiquinone oxidoreductase subunit 3 (subunit A)
MDDGRIALVGRETACYNDGWHTLFSRARASGYFQPSEGTPVSGLGYLYAGLFFLVGLGFVVLSTGAARILNALLLRRKPAPAKRDTYESGEVALGSAWVQYPLAFYIFALLFVAFDVDIVFIIAWAVIFQNLGWFGFAEIAFFIIVLALGLAYAWRKGVTKWI